MYCPTSLWVVAGGWGRWKPACHCFGLCWLVCRHSPFILRAVANMKWRTFTSRVDRCSPFALHFPHFQLVRGLQVFENMSISSMLNTGDCSNLPSQGDVCYSTVYLCREFHAATASNHLPRGCRTYFSLETDHWLVCWPDQWVRIIQLITKEWDGKYVNIKQPELLYVYRSFRQ